MHAYELLPRLSLLTLTGQDEDGDLEFVGTNTMWNSVSVLENELLNK